MLLRNILNLKRLFFPVVQPGVADGKIVGLIVKNLRSLSTTLEFLKTFREDSNDNNNSGLSWNLHELNQRAESINFQ